MAASTPSDNAKAWDARRFVLNETGTEFGIAWYEYQIKQLVASFMKP